MNKNSIFQNLRKLTLWVLSLLVLTALLGSLFAQPEKEELIPKDAGASEEASQETGEEPATVEGEKISDKEGSVAGKPAIDGTESTAQGVIWRNKESGQLYGNTHVRFTLSATDNVSRTDYIEYKDNDGEYIRYSSPFLLGKEGPHNIMYRAVDRAGNREFDHSFNVIIDEGAPEVDLVPARAFVEKSGRRYTSLGNTFTIRAFDRYSGIKSVTYSINNSTKSPYVDSNTIQLSQSGPQLIQYEAVDNLGNNTKGASVLVEVDDTRPTATIRPTQPLRLVDNLRYARRATGFDVIGEDTGSGVSQIMVRIDGSQQWQAYNGTLYFSTETEHTISAKVVDAVGNESEIVTSRFKVDDNPPITELNPSVKEKPSAPSGEGSGDNTSVEDKN